MSKQPLARWQLRYAAIVTALVLLSPAFAADPAGQAGALPALTDLRGHFSVNYYHSGLQGSNVAYGGSEGVLGGLTFGAALEFRLADFKIDLTADDLALDRQNLALNVTGKPFSSRLSFINLPPATAADERHTDFSVHNTLRLPGLPNATLAFAHRSDSADRSRFSVNASLSDSYRDITPDVQGLRWNATYRTGSDARSGQPTRAHHDVQLRLDLDVTERGRPDVRFRPGIAVQLRQDAAVEARFRQRYTVALDAESLDGLERLGVKLALEADSRAEPRTQQKFSYSTRQFGLLTVTGEISADQGGDVRKTDYRLGAGFNLSETVRLDGGYHGRAGSAGSSNGLEASIAYRYTIRPWYLNATASGDLQFLTAGGTEAAARLNMSLRYQGEQFSAAGNVNLNYGRQGWRGRAEFSGDYQAAWGGLSLATGVLLSNSVAANLSVSGHRRIAGAWSIQGNGDYRIEFADDINRVFTLGVGLRYDFGGER